MDAKSCPTGIPLTPKSEALFFTEKSTVLSDMSAVNLGDISIRSKVQFDLFIVSTTTLSPLMLSNSL